MEEQAQALTASVSVFKLQTKASAPARRVVAEVVAPKKAAVHKPAAREPEPALADGDWQEF